MIDSTIVAEDFDTARKLIDKLPAGERKKQSLEKVNTKEATSLVRKGELVAAQNLAERLSTAGSILQVYPLIVEAYATKKNQTGPSIAVRQAVKQLKLLGNKPSAFTSAQLGIPIASLPTATERDGILLSLSKLAKAVLPIDTLLATEIVDEIVTRANSSQIDTAQGQTGLDSELFKGLAAKDEVRARSAAESFKDRLRRVVALAAIYQAKAKELDRGTKGVSSL